MPPIAGKRVLQTMPEPALEPIQATAIVVIHPGSYWLRIGRASDAYPHSIPNCIARRHKKAGQKPYLDQLLLRKECMKSEHHMQQRLTGLKFAEESIKYRPTSSGEVRHPSNYKQLLHLNNQERPIISDIESPMTWTNTRHKQETFIGDQALYLHPSDCYNIHWPIRNGHLNLHDKVGGTLTAVTRDIEAIWSYAIESQLAIPLKDLKHYRAVLLIPDIYDRRHVRVMMDILLKQLGFSAAFCHQESVCATFGAGVSSACVLDVGDQKTAVCCVEDGLSQKNTRLCMEYGGRDITRCFYWLVQRAGFPYKECELARRIDALFLQELKENHCHMDHDIYGIMDQTIQIKVPGKHIVKYQLNYGDEVLLAPMALFYPDMLGLTAAVCRAYHKGASDPSDPHDEGYLQQTQSRQEAAARAVAARKKENVEPTKSDNMGDMDDSNIIVEDDDTNDPGEASVDAPSGSGRNRKQEEEENGMDESCGIIGIDQAILQSIDKCDSDDMKRRMYSCIVIVGGGANFNMVDGWVKYAVWTQMPAHFRLTLETMDVIAKPKDMEPTLTCWKGGSILSCLDTAQELWIRSQEWQRYGVRMLRERAPFVW